MSWRASATWPALATPTWSSALWSFSMLSGSISGERARLSAARTTPSSARIPTLAVPRFTASRAYSTW
jgi:hypothetical protein